MTEFLNTDCKRYYQLMRDEKHTVIDNDIDGCCEWLSPDGWVTKEHEGIHRYGVYRTKPKEYKKLDIPWQHIDEKWKYAVMDGCETVLLYATKPEWLSEHNMWSCNHQYHSISPLKLDTTGIVAEHSLTQRPEGV